MEEDKAGENKELQYYTLINKTSLVDEAQEDKTGKIKHYSILFTDKQKQFSK